MPMFLVMFISRVSRIATVLGNPEGRWPSGILGWEAASLPSQPSWLTSQPLTVEGRYLPATRTTTAEMSFTSTKASKYSAPVRDERCTMLSVTCATLPPSFSPDRRCSSTDLPALLWMILSTVAFGCRPAFSWASKLEQVIVATKIPRRSK
jgi:hypothetical protein